MFFAFWLDFHVSRFSALEKHSSRFGTERRSRLVLFPHQRWDAYGDVFITKQDFVAWFPLNEFTYSWNVSTFRRTRMKSVENKQISSAAVHFCSIKSTDWINITSGEKKIGKSLILLKTNNDKTSRSISLSSKTCATFSSCLEFLYIGKKEKERGREKENFAFGQGRFGLLNFGNLVVLHRPHKVKLSLDIHTHTRA